MTRNSPFHILLALFPSVPCWALGDIGPSQGGIVFQAFGVSSNPAHDRLKVELWRYDRDASGALLPLLKRDVYRADGQTPALEMLLEVPPPEGHIYRLPNVPMDDNVSYALLAYTCQSHRGRLDFAAGLVPLGWAVDPSTCVGSAPGSEVCATPLRPTAAADVHSVTNIPKVFLASPTPFGDARSHEFGRIWTTAAGQRILRMNGSPRQRGLAHGYLAASQVMDVLRFFFLEDRVLRGPGRGVKEYEEVTLATLRAGRLFRTPAAVLEEARGILDGIHAAGVSIAIPELGGRDATEWDLVALSAYGQLFVLNPQTDVADRAGSCSQFVQEAVGVPHSLSDDYPIHARNMDGEVDVRKVTVSHLLIFAIDRDPEDSGSLRFISVMWPGFIGTFSAMNEKGSSVMVNFGCPRPGAAAAQADGGYSVDTQVVRDFVSHADGLSPEGAVDFLQQRHMSKTGGIIVQGILVFARASQERSAFLYEGDSYGGALRLPGNATVWPNTPGLVMATNHYHKYAVDERQARKLTDGAGDPMCNGAPVSFSSMWRYKSGLGYISALSRQKGGAALDETEMRGALKAVAEGMTEHSIIFKPATRQVAVAVASLSRVMWDAPSEAFEEFDFEYFFDHSTSSYMYE